MKYAMLLVVLMATGMSINSQAQTGYKTKSVYVDAMTGKRIKAKEKGYIDTSFIEEEWILIGLTKIVNYWFHSLSNSIEVVYISTCNLRIK